MDQTNPLAELTHKRRLSALGSWRVIPRKSRFRGAGTYIILTMVECVRLKRQRDVTLD